MSWCVRDRNKYGKRRKGYKDRPINRVKEIETEKGRERQKNEKGRERIKMVRGKERKTEIDKKKRRRRDAQIDRFT